MEKSSKRGKIPQSDWPLIMARYEAGETLASIARTYDCSPPAISYVVSRSRARRPEAAAPAKPPSATEPQLIKASPTDIPANGATPPPARDQSVVTAAEADTGARAEADQRAVRAELAAANPGRGDIGGHRDEAPGREFNGFARNGFGERNPP